VRPRRLRPYHRDGICATVLVLCYRQQARLNRSLEKGELENGVRYRKPERPEGCFAFSVPDPVFPALLSPAVLERVDVMKLSHLAVCCLGLSLLAAAPQQKEQKPQPDEVLDFKQVGDKSLTLHVFLPAGHAATDRRPAIVFFFGGGWNGGTPSQFYGQSRHLADRGMVAICADYRTKSKYGTSPQECVRDGKSAIRWVRSHAAELGVDPQRIAAGGGSAGGHVAAATAVVDGFEEETEDHAVSCRPTALVLFNPVYDNGPDGYGFDRVKDYWQQFSPLHNIDEDAPPTIVFLGTRDKLIPVATAEAWQAAMQKVKVRSDLHLYQNEGHGFFNRGESYKDTLQKTDDFLVSLGYLQPAAEE
jgi:acetyl esterase